ncbi:MAG TPA: ABC transporter transmembrane domain-containing protein [Gemmatimonadaceae bacterium]|nr:ABC transporter transmembrane domain-containing protein [Gemmatimonadaceae bacterium]
MAATAVQAAEPKSGAKKDRKPISPTALARLFPRVKPYIGQLSVALVCLLAASAAGLAFPAIVAVLLDTAFQHGNATFLNEIAVGLLLLFAVQASLNMVQVYLLTSTAERVIAKLRTDLFAHMVHLSPGFFTDRRTGELTSRLSSDTSVLQTVLSTNLSEFTRQSIFLIGALVMLTVKQPALTGTTLAVVPLVVGAAFIFGRMLRRASTGVQDRIAEATGTADEAFSQIRMVQSFTAESEETRKYDKHLFDVVRAAVDRAKIRGVFFGALTFFGFSGVVVVLWEGGRLVLAGQLTAGALVSFLLYAMYVAGAVASLASLFGAYQEAAGAAHRIFELMDMTPTVVDPVAPVALPRPRRGDVALEHVHFRYQPELPEALHDVSLHIGPGEIVALVGPSGAGKTTVASLLPRFWDVTGGCITFDGMDIRDLSLRDLRESIGVVPQEPTLFSGTVRDNIAYALAGDSVAVPDSAIESAARAANAHEFIVRLPQGYDTAVGERGVKLSGGQRQRLAIARVFLKDPALVILDEATSSLDSESERLVEAAMEELLRGRSTLIIAHRLSTVLRADRVVVLEHGHVVETGSHADLLDAEGMYAKLYRGQFRAGDRVALESM